MLSIRMRRTGSKKRPFYRVVVTEGREPREGSFLEILGTYNPRTKPAMVEIDKERVDALDQAGRAAVGLGAHAARAASDEGPRRRARAPWWRPSAGGPTPDTRAPTTPHAGVSRPWPISRDSSNVSRARAGRRTGCRARRRERAARDDGDRAAGGAGRPRPRDRPAGPHRRGRAHAAVDRRGRRRQARDARHSRRVSRSARDGGMAADWDEMVLVGVSPGRTAIRGQVILQLGNGFSRERDSRSAPRLYARQRGRTGRDAARSRR